MTRLNIITNFHPFYPMLSLTSPRLTIGLAPFCALLLGAASLFPEKTAAQGCCGNSYSQGSMQLNTAFPTLNQRFGGIDSRAPVRLTHSGLQKIEVKHAGTTTQLEGNETKYVPPNIGGEEQPLPGEPGGFTSDTISNNGGSPGSGELKAEGDPQVCTTGSSPTQPSPEQTLQDGDEMDAPVSTPQQDGGGGGGNDGGGMPSPSTPAAPGEPPTREIRDKSPTEKHGAAMQSGPGTAKPILDPMTGGVAAGEDVAPNIIVAAGLGKSSDDDGAGGYLVPNPSRPLSGGAGTPPVGPEKITYYKARISDIVLAFNGITPPTTNDLRWSAGDGLTILKQETSAKARIEVYSPTDYDSSGTGFPLNPGAVPRRVTTVEKLSSGNPDALKYTTGYRMRTAVGANPAAWETTWTSAVISSGGNYIMYSYVKRELESIPGYSLVESVSTRAALSTDRVIDLTVTESVQQPSVSGSISTSTIVRKSREKRRVFLWGEETIEAITYLTPSTGGAAVTAYTDWYDNVAQSDPNYGRVRLRRETDGRWEAYFAGVADPAVSQSKLSGTLRGWKNTAAPTGVTTAAALAGLADDVGYAGTISSKRQGERPLRTEEWSNGSMVAKSEDLTPAQNFRTTTKRWASGSEYFITVSTRNWNGYPRNTFELKANTTPADLTQDPDWGDCISVKYSSNGAGGTQLVVEDAAHLPCLGSETHTDMSTGLVQGTRTFLVTGVNSDGSPNAYSDLTGDYRYYDSMGRPEYLYDLNYNILESWTYPANNKVSHTDRKGVTRLYEYDPQGRLLRESVLTVGAVTVSDMPGSPLLPAQSYHNVTEWFRQAPAVSGTISRTTKRLSAKTAVDGAVYGSWQRSWVEHIDGLGRSVAAVDHLGTRRDAVYVHGAGGTTVTTSIPGTSGGTLSVESTYLSRQSKSSVHPSIGGLGGSASDIYYDHTSASYARTLKADHYNTFSGSNGYESRTTDGIGRIISSIKPTGMNGGGLYLHTENRTYDNHSRLLSRNLPVAASSGSLYEVFAYTQTAGLSELKTNKALSTNASWDSGDASQSVSIHGYIVDLDSGLWSWGEKTWDGTTSSGPPRETLLSHLELLYTTEYTTMGTWILTAASSVISGGKASWEYEYSLPGTSLTRTRKYVDGELRMSVTSHNGLPVLYDTNGTTYSSKLASFNLLRQRESEVSEESGYWSKTLFAEGTGLPYVKLMPDNSTYQYWYSWYTGDNFRSGKMSSQYEYVKPAYRYYDYNARGQRTREWGSGTSPSQMVYDALGRVTELHTWRSGSWTASSWPSSPPAADIIQWTYPAMLGLQLSKIHPDLGGQDIARRTIGYTYHPNGSIASRTWQRLPSNSSLTAAGSGVITSYVYDAFARLQKVDYPASSLTVADTPDVTFTYNTAGRIDTRTEAGQATTNYLYTSWGQPRKETVTSLLSTIIAPSELERTYDSLGRPDLIKVKSGATVAPDADYNFSSTTGLLSNVVSDGRTITYAYTSGGSVPTGTPRSLTYAHSGSTLLTTDIPRNTRGLVDSVSHVQSSVPILYQSMSYSYSVDRLTSVTHGHEGNMYWNFGYDSRNQVISADKKFSSGGEFAAGLQTQYTYDMAGNRLTKNQGGSATTVEGTGVRVTTYGAANAVNQYPSVDHPDDGTNTWIDITGLRGSSSEDIKVNTVLAGYQQGASGLSFYREVPYSASTGVSRYFSVNVTKTVAGTTTTLDSGTQYVPPAQETLLYDADGNLTQDHRFIYKYDAENRLAQVSLANSSVSSPSPSYNLIYNYYYDGLSRMVAKKTNLNFNPATLYYVYQDAFVYDGWNLVMSGKGSGYAPGSGYSPGPPANPIGTNRVCYVWGPDINSTCTGHGSWQTAGGINGLLLVNGSTDALRQFPLMDRMGNVTGYRRAVTGSPAALDAVFEYDAFGREVRSTGPASNTMVFRFSTKLTDVDTGFIYYGYRFYDPDRGRWINRDPILENGGFNLYGFADNSPSTKMDILGMSPVDDIMNTLVNTASMSVSDCMGKCRDECATCCAKAIALIAPLLSALEASSAAQAAKGGLGSVTGPSSSISLTVATAKGLASSCQCTSSPPCGACAANLYNGFTSPPRSDSWGITWNAYKAVQGLKNLGETLAW